MRLKFGIEDVYIHETAEGSFIVVPHSVLDIEINDIQLDHTPEELEARRRAEALYGECQFFVARFNEEKIEFNFSTAVNLTFWLDGRIRPCTVRDFDFVKSMRTVLEPQFKYIKANMTNVEKTIAKVTVTLSRTTVTFKEGDVLVYMSVNDRGQPYVTEKPNFYVITKGGTVTYESEGAAIESEVEYGAIIFPRNGAAYEMSGKRKLSGVYNGIDDVTRLRNINTLSPEDAAKFQYAITQVKDNMAAQQTSMLALETMISDRAKEEVALIEE